MSVRAKVYLLLGVLLLCVSGAYVYKRNPGWFGTVPAANAAGPEPEKGKAEQDATPVELAPATRGDISSFIAATANLRALREISVATQVDGIVREVLAEEGDSVEEGQVLCTFDDTQLRIQLELAKEKLAQARLQLEKARIRHEKASAQIGHTQAELTRYEKAHKEGLVSEKEVAAYQYKREELVHDQRVAASETKELHHRVGELEAEIAQTELEIARTRVKAPFAGFITQRTVNIGQRVRALEALFNLGSLSPLYADVHLSEYDTRSVRPSQEAVVRLGISESLAVRGSVQRISPVVDQSTGTIKVTVSLNPRDPGFRPGAFVRVQIRTDTHLGAVLIPKRAVLEEDGQSFVYVAQNDTARRQKVELGYQNEGMVEIRNGISPGQKVVVAGQGALKEGAKIKTVQG